MKNNIIQFIAKVRQFIFTLRIEREIYGKIAPQVLGEAEHGYPFHTDDELVEAHIRAGLDAQLNLDIIEMTAAQMPAAYGKAFRYLAYRDLNARMEMYKKLAEERVFPKTCDPRFVATAA